MIKLQLTQRMKETMKAGDARLLSVIRLLLAELQKKEKEKQGQGKDVALTDEEAMGILQREAKKRRESIEIYKKGGREDLVESESYELKVVEEYLPQQMSREEIERAVGDVRGAGRADFNSVMKETMKRVSGRADGKAVSEVIKANLG